MQDLHLSVGARHAKFDGMDGALAVSVADRLVLRQVLVLQPAFQAHVSKTLALLFC